MTITNHRCILATHNVVDDLSNDYSFRFRQILFLNLMIVSPQDFHLIRTEGQSY